MQKRWKFTAALSLVAVLSSCGGGGSSGGAPPVAGPAPTPTPTNSTGCSLSERQVWAASVLQEWYLFPELIAPGVDPSAYDTVQGYIDALLAPARAAGKDRYFTRLLSIAQNDSASNTGGASGLGFRLTGDAVTTKRVFVLEAFEGAPALAAGIDRGTEILAIGTGASNLKTIAAIIDAGGSAALSAAFEPQTLFFRIRQPSGATADVTVTKAAYTLDTVSDRYGALVLEDGGKKVGYLNFRVFFGSPSQTDLRAAFAKFRAAGVTEIIVDLRYNTGGLNTTVELLNRLMLGNLTNKDVLMYTRFRPSKSSNDLVSFFAPQPESIAATKIAFIATGTTISASELTMNNVLPYLGANAALIGSNTAGKPVGAIGVDRPACDDRMSVISFANFNRNNEGGYFDGMASRFQSTCKATDDLTRQLGDPQEAMIKTALDFLGGRACTPISATSSAPPAAPNGALGAVQPGPAGPEIKGPL